MNERLHPSEGEFKISPIVYVILHREDDAIFFIQRKNGNYSLPAGHIERGEKVFDAAIREAREEVGVEIDEAELRLVHIGHFKDPDGHRVAFFVQAPGWRGEPRNMEAEKHIGTAWFTQKNMPGNTVTYVRNALDSISRGEVFREQGFRGRWDIDK